MSGNVYVQYFVMITLVQCLLYFKACGYKYCVWKDDMKYIPFFTSPSIPSFVCVCVCVCVYVCVDEVTYWRHVAHLFFISDKQKSHFSTQSCTQRVCSVYVVLQMPVYDNMILVLFVYSSWMLNRRKKSVSKMRKKRSISIRNKILIGMYFLFFIFLLFVFARR